MTKPGGVFVKWAILGSLGLTLFYFLLTSLVSRSVVHPFDQFVSLQPWISVLILSFGIQVGLYQVIRQGVAMMKGTSVTSGISMVLCCVHHASDFLPILGLSGLGLVLTAYQKDFLILGVILNILGTIYLLKLFFVRYSPVFKYSILAFAGLLVAFGVLAITKDMYTKMLLISGAKEIIFEPQTKQVGVVGVEVTPKQLSHGQQMIFTITLNNHSIDLNYDYTKIATVVDSRGNIYKPVRWDGPVGGHHISGDLVFDKLSNKAESVGLNLTGIDNQNASFEWRL